MLRRFIARLVMAMRGECEKLAVMPCNIRALRIIYSLAHMRRPDIAGWSSLVARRAHNPEVVGSNPAPATKQFKYLRKRRYFFMRRVVFA